MASEIQTPANVSDNSAVGSAGWTCAHGDLDDNDGIESSVSLGSGSQSHYLQAIGCGFAIPSDATIDGILVSVLRRVANGSGGLYPAVRDTVVKLTHGGSVVGTNQADTGTDWPASELEADYGGLADTWGAGLAVSQINHSSFGVVISASASGGVSPDTAYIDRVVITVYYTVPVATGEEAIYVSRVRLDLVEDDERGASRFSFDPYPIPEPTVDDFYQAISSRSSRALDDEDESSSRMSYVSAAEFAAPTTESVFVFAGSSRPFEDDEQSRSCYAMPPLVGIEQPICDCAGIAIVVRAGYGTAIVRSFGVESGESPSFGTATIRGGYGVAKIIISCQC